MNHSVVDLWIYRHRYLIGWTTGILILVGVVVLTAFFVPDGLRPAEEASSLSSTKLSFMKFDPSTVINLPYHLLQLASFTVFGVSQISIKLPSLIFAIIGIVGVYVLILYWFRQKIAIITSIIAATLPVLMFMSQDGTPNIYTFTMSIWLLVTGTLITHSAKHQLLWKTIFLTLFSLNLYTPLGVYLNLALISTSLLHPHIRLVIKKLDTKKIAFAGGVSLLVLAPLLYSLVAKPAIALGLLGIPQHLPDIWQNLQSVWQSLFGFMGNGDSIIHPILSIPVAIIAGIGIYEMFTTRHTARSYVVWAWSLFVLIAMILTPELAIFATPIVIILLAYGMDGLIHGWYKLFPLNPYARVGGLIPLGVITIGVITGNFIAYGLNYQYSASILKNFNNDISLLSTIVKRADLNKPVYLAVSKQKKPFYDIFAKYRKDIKVMNETDIKILDNKIIHVSAMPSTPNNPELIADIITNSRSNEAARFYIYAQPKK